MVCTIITHVVPNHCLFELCVFYLAVLLNDGVFEGSIDYLTAFPYRNAWPKGDVF